MINVFQCPYAIRLKSWHDLKNSLVDTDLKTKCISIDKWWQAAPLVNHYLHTDFIQDWPNPWELLAENNYCNIARGLGIIYTLLMVNEKQIDFFEATDSYGDQTALITVDNAKYIMNHWPDMVVNNRLQNFKIGKCINIAPILKKITIGEKNEGYYLE